MTLTDFIRQQSAAAPTQIAFRFIEDGAERDISSYSALDRDARAIAAALQRMGRAGMPILLLYPPGLDYIRAFLGCLYAGAIAVPAYPPDPGRLARTLPRLQAIVQDSRATTVLTTRLVRGMAEAVAEHAPELAALEWIATDEIDGETARAWKRPEIDDTSLAFLQYTSGSTGSPKGVMLTHGNLVHNQRMIQAAFGHSASSVIVGWLPLYHDMGLIGNVLQPLYLGATCVLMSPMACLKRPAQWLQAISRYRGTTSGGPNFAYDLCLRRVTDEERAGLDLSSWTVAFNGAEPIRPATIERFAARFAAFGFQRKAFYPCYGLAEATLIVTGATRGQGPTHRSFERESVQRGQPQERSTDGVVFVSSGRSLGDQSVMVVDPETWTPVTGSGVGEIWISGDSVAAGYWRNPEATLASFGARLTGDRSRRTYLRTGDLGFFMDGEVYIAGRLKDLIILRGRNHYPQDIELTVERSHASLRPGCGAAFSIDTPDGEGLAVVQEMDTTRGEPNEVLGLIREAIAQTHEIVPVQIVLVRPGSIPKTSSGKIQRRACRVDLLEGRMKTIVSFTDPADDAAPAGPAPSELVSRQPLSDEEISDLQIARAVIARRLRLDPAAVDSKVSLSRFGIDSVAAIELQHDLEVALGRRVPLAEILSGASVMDIIRQPRPKSKMMPRGRKIAATEERGPASPRQQDLWFLEQLAKDKGPYNLANAAVIRGPLNIVALRDSFDELARRHGALRTVFEIEGGSPIQRILAAPLSFFTEEDFSWMSEPALAQRLAQAARAPFRLGEGPLFRVLIGRRSPVEHVLLLVMHHAIIDFWSVAILLKELGHLYTANVEGRATTLPLPDIDPIDIANWQFATLMGEEGNRQTEFWAERLRGLDEPLALKTDYPRPLLQTFAGATERLTLPPSLAARIRTMAEREGCTQYHFLLAAFQLLLHSCCGQPDIVVGTSLAGRDAPELADVVGYLVAPVAIRTRFDSTSRFVDVVKRVRDEVLEAMRNQDVPISHIVKRLRPRRDLSRSPIFQVYFVQQSIPVLGSALGPFALGEPGALMHLESLVFESMALPGQSAPFDLTLMVAEHSAGLGAALQYNTSLFASSTAKRMLESLQILLQAAAEDPNAVAVDLPITEQSRNRPTGGRGSGAEVLALHRRFEAQARRRPEATGLMRGGQSWSYDELNRRANRIALHLRQSGIERENRVGLLLERSPEMVAAILGILKAGGAYVPIDPGNPPDRISFILADANVQAIVTQSELAHLVVPRPGVQSIIIGHGPSADADCDEVNPDIEVDEDHLAYVIYTSGSTGRPKGVLVTHRQAVRLFDQTQAWYGFGPQDVWTLFHSIAFDFSVWEVFGALLYGGRLIIVGHDESRAPEVFHELVRREGVTVLNQTPSAFRQFIAADTKRGGSLALRYVIFGGEALEMEMLRPWWTRHGDGAPRLVNMYGITETTVHVTYRPLSLQDLEGRSSCIGTAIPDLAVYLLDPELQPVPAGALGEIYVGGAGVARGYLGRPELSAERFLPDPWSKILGARMYRSGDLARQRADGDLEYLGRADQQVKIRGFRIELGEIETALLRVPGVAQAVVRPLDDAIGGKRLVAYYVQDPSPRLSADTLRERLGAVLPDYMVPSAFVPLATMPLTTNGKLDTDALPAPEQILACRPDAIVARTPTEEAIARIWCELFGRGAVTADDDFFALGGHSLFATQFVLSLQKILGFEVPLHAVFETPRLGDLAARIDSQIAETTAPNDIAPTPRSGRNALSQAQRRLWFLQQLEPASAAYNMPAAVRLSGPLDLHALRSSFAAITRRHEVLRCGFPVNDGEPVIEIADAVEPSFAVRDLGALPSPTRLEVALDLAREEARRPFDLARRPLLRLHLLRLTDTEHLLVVVLHHIVGDGWSIGIFLRELEALYRAASSGQPPPLPDLPLQYLDVARWQDEQRGPAVIEQQLEYWRKAIDDSSAFLQLPSDRPRPRAQSHRGAHYAFRLEPESVEPLRRLARELDATPFMAFLAAFEVLLHRYSGQTQFSIGTPISGRIRAEMEGLIGFFVNTLVMRADFSGEPSFKEVIRRTRATAVGGYAHQDVPFDTLVADLQPDRDLSRSPLFQVMFALEEAPVRRFELGDVRAELLEFERGTAQFDLTLDLAVEPDGGVSASLEYATDLFDQATVAAMASHYAILVKNLVREPDRAVSAVSILAKNERELLSQWNATAFDGPDACLHELFERQVERTPDAVAVAIDGERATYRQLELRANQLAAALRKGHIGSEERVAICMRRSIDMIVAMLAVLKAGAAYAPLDADYPEQRIALMLADSGARTILTQTALVGGLPRFDGAVIEVDRKDAAWRNERSARPKNTTLVDQLAYVIYTSGSTGRPKAVMTSHRSVGNYMAATQMRYPLQANDRALQINAISFDASVSEIFLPLLAGARLILASPGEQKDPAALVRRIRSEEVTVIQVVPSVLSALLDEPGFADCVTLRKVFCGGEALPVEVQDRLLHLLQVELVNLYGPTEATIDPVTFRCVAGQRGAQQIAKVGRPNGNMRVYVLDHALELVPARLPGEAYFAGVGLSRGYLNDPAMTADRFVPDPFSGEPGSRMYRSGDLARWDSNGALEFLGRVDHQVKIRGFRIELGEIEAALVEIPDVREAAVLAREDEPGDKRLVAYIVAAAPSHPPSPGELREALARRLPDYMLPADFVIREGLPLSPNGKVDRGALPAPDRARSGRAHAPPRTPTEDALVDIWKGALGREALGIHDDFFELGGHSLRAAQVAARAGDVLGQEVPVRAVFDAPTIANLAAWLDARRGRAIERPALRRVEEERRVMLLSFAQERLWFLEQLHPGAATFSIAGAARMTGALDRGALRRALEVIIARHEPLRTCFRIEEGRPVPVLNAAAIELPVIPIGTENVEATVRRLAAEEASRPFDLTRDSMLRVSLIALGEGEHVLVVNIHHIAADGWSIGVFLQELAQLYDREVGGDASELPPLPLSYSDYVQWQREWLKPESLRPSLEYWKRKLAGAPEVLPLPLDRSRPVVQTFAGARTAVSLSRELTDSLTALGRREGATLYMTLLAAFQLLLARYSGTKDIVVGTPLAGRGHAEIDGLIGLFVNMLPLRGDFSDSPTMRKFLRRTRETVLEAYTHQDVPFEQLVDALAPQRDLGRAPIFQVMFALQNSPMPPIRLGSIELEAMDLDTGTAKYELSLEMSETASGLVGHFEWNTDLFDRATVERMASHFVTLLGEICAHPDRRALELELVAARERERILRLASSSEPTLPADGRLEMLVAEQVRRTPDATAIVHRHRRISYGELEESAERLARKLVGRGLGPGAVAGIALERSIEMVVALVAVLKTGAAYLPLDSKYPPERIAFMVADARPLCVLTQGGAGHRHSYDVATIDIDDDLGADESTPLVSLPTDLSPRGAAYLIYTSGSTGRPKGTVIEHASAVTLIRWARRWFRPADLAGVLASTSICFDLSIFELFVPLCSGGKIILADNALELATLAARDEVTFVNTVPSAIVELLRSDAIPTSVRSVALAGEPLRNDVVQSLHEAGIARVYDLYGPTETTTYSTACLRTGDGVPSVGRPIANTSIYVLDESLALIPGGVVGEIYIGGAGVARGYWQRADLTADRFMPDPFSGIVAARMYKTGDLARYLPDGSLELLGRADNQVKIRGFRIELGEVEAALSSQPTVEEVVVVVDGEGASRRLVAYVVLSAHDETSGANVEGAASMLEAVAELRGRLRASMPEFMVPSLIIPVDHLPRTPSGKIDRRALPALTSELRANASHREPPASDVEERIGAIWREELGLTRVGREDNFFDVGGNSLLAVRVHARMKRSFSRDFAVFTLFQYPTIAALGRYLGDEGQQAPSSVIASEKQTAGIRRLQLMRKKVKADG